MKGRVLSYLIRMQLVVPFVLNACEFLSPVLSPSIQGISGQIHEVTATCKQVSVIQTDEVSPFQLD